MVTALKGGSPLKEGSGGLGSGGGGDPVMLVGVWRVQRKLKWIDNKIDSGVFSSSNQTFLLLEMTKSEDFYSQIMAN